MFLQKNVTIRVLKLFFQTGFANYIFSHEFILIIRSRMRPDTIDWHNLHYLINCQPWVIMVRTRVVQLTYLLVKA